MKLVKTIIAVFAAIAIFSGTCAAQININDLSAYYGFGEIEIIKLDHKIAGLNIVDFNGDGRADIAVVNNRKAKIEVLIQKKQIEPGEPEVTVDANDIDINAIIAPTRFKRSSVAVSQKISSFVCGDLNSDGMMDLAFYGDPKGLYVILQRAGESETKEQLTVSWRTWKKIKINDGLLTRNALVCADLNNDGADDLALAGSDGVYIILQKDGALAEPVKYPTTTRTLAVKVGDLNGDTINDLVLVTNDREKPIHVRFGLSTGQLGPQIRFFIEKPLALELANSDGTVGDEILTINSLSGRLGCYKFAYESDEDTDWPILFYPLESGEASTKRDLEVSDFDGDNLVDVIISDPEAAELIFYKQSAGLGLAEPVRFPTFADIESLSIADIDGDGKTEVGVLSIKEKIIGISNFEDNRFSFPKPLELVGEPVAMELADVDGDGSIDCLYISKDTNDVRSMRVKYDVGAESKQDAKGRKKRSATARDGGSVVVIKDLASNPDGLKVLDVDQDGLQDVLVFVKYEDPVLIRQTKKREFEIVDSPKAQASLIKDASLSSIAIADVNGKAGQELLVAHKNFARSLIFAGGKKWSVLDQYNAKSPENNIVAVAAFDLADYKSDGQPAILLIDGPKGQLQILKAGIDKTYRVEKELDVGSWNAAKHLKCLFEPLTGTEQKSILLFDSEKFALITAPSASSIPASLEQQFSYETKIKDGAYGNMAVGDINGDGRSDIIMVEYKHSHFEILALDSSAKPVPVMRFKIFEQKGYRQEKRGKSSVEPRELKIADVTGDGKDDLVTIIHDRIIIYPQD